MHTIGAGERNCVMAVENHFDPLLSQQVLTDPTKSLVYNSND